MVEVTAVIVFAATATTWLRVAMPRLAHAWATIARDLDPADAVAQALLFSASPRTHP